MTSAGIAPGDWTKVISRDGELTAQAFPKEDLYEDVVWVVPGAGGSRFNELLPWRFDPRSSEMDTTMVRVRVVKLWNETEEPDGGESALQP